MTLTLDFICQILKKKNYVSGNGGSIEVKRKGCESIGCWTHYVTLSYHPDLAFPRSNFEKNCIPGVGWPIDMDPNRCKFGPTLWLWLTSPITLTLDFQGLINKKAASQEWERKRCESIGCWTQYVTLSYDLDLGLPSSNCEIALSDEWVGPLTWNERSVSQ